MLVSEKDVLGFLRELGSVWRNSADEIEKCRKKGHVWKRLKIQIEDECQKCGKRRLVPYRE